MTEPQPTNDLEALAAKMKALITAGREARAMPNSGFAIHLSVIEEAYDALTALRSIAAPKQDAEVVAWLITDPSGRASDLCRVGLTEADKRNGFTAIPLYAQPPAKPDAACDVCNGDCRGHTTAELTAKPDAAHPVDVARNAAEEAKHGY